MTLIWQDINDRLKQLDEVTLLELLEISSEDLVERFQDFIENKIDKIEEEVQ